jgi:probable phosphoglycerate mutase
MTVFVVRHGRTTANATGLLLGRADPELDEIGRDQARRIAGALPRDITVISSPLQRASQTAASISAEVVIDERLIELDYGEFDLTPVADVPAEIWMAWRVDPHFRLPGGESLFELSERMAELLDEIAPLAAGGRHVALVTHVSPIKAAMAWALGVGIELSWRCNVGQASLTRIEVSDRGPSLYAFNDTHHLDPS